MAFRAPLLGYNTNVRHKGKLYHIQTEDSGVGHPHVITHLFADGGRIVASKKTSYGDQVGSQGLQDTVKKLMQAQHKAMFIALRDGVYDENGPNDAARDQTGTHALVPPAGSGPSPVAAAPAPAAPVALAPEDRASTVYQGVGGERTSLYQGTRAAGRGSDRPAIATPASAKASSPQGGTPNSTTPPRGSRSIFGGDLLSEKSLDEVILSYLASDDPDPKR